MVTKSKSKKTTKKTSTTKKATTSSSKSSSGNLYKDLSSKSVNEIRDELVKIIKRDSYMEEDIILSSGQVSDFVLDLRQAILGAEGNMLVGLGIMQHLKEDIQSIGGLSSHAYPLAIATTQVACHQNRNINTFIVRKEPRKYGKSKWVEGPIMQGDKVCIVSDLVTNGSNIVKTIRDVQEEFNAQVCQVICVLDRNEGGKERIEELGIEFDSLCTIEDIKNADS